MLKLNINGSKLKLPYLEHENNNMWLTEIIINYKIEYNGLKSKLTKSETHKHIQTKLN